MTPRRFKTAKDFEEAVEKYLTYCKEDKLPITVTGFALYAKINISKLKKNYKDVGEYAEVYNSLLAHAKNDLINNALLGNYNAAISKLLLGFNHGMKEEQVVKEDITIKFKGKVF